MEDYEKALKDVRTILTLDPNYMMFYGHMHGDQLRDRIHVIVKKEDLKNWEVELKEGKTYYMYNFRVVPNDGQYKVCAHPFKLFFTGGTTLRQVDLAEIPLKSFEFKSFEDIDNGNYDPNMLIGELVLVLYRLEVMVYHNEQSTKFLCWDHGCINLIGQSDDEVNSNNKLLIESIKMADIEEFKQSSCLSQTGLRFRDCNHIVEFAFVEFVSALPSKVISGS
ncbi:hypothetical protein JHK87_022630 [Glycine soja]|nr:hypothetical protein JHK87_022630 [Glycine soja]